jgi:hypothetical protein
MDFEIPQTQSPKTLKLLEQARQAGKRAVLLRSSTEITAF